MNAPLPVVAQGPLRTDSPGAGWNPAATAWQIAIVFAMQIAAYALQKDVSLSLDDEGFLWYGVQRVVAGEVPLRDFQAYDIARYYWYAAWMWVSGTDGVAALRAGSAALGGLTVVLALWLMRTSGRQPLVVTALALVSFTVWMVPYFKVADSFAALLVLAGMVRLLEAFSLRRCFECGMSVGAAATIGINHGLYGVLAVALAMAWLHTAGRFAFTARGLAALTLGGAVGYLPMIVFLVAVPGFASAFADGVRLLFETGATNIDRALPSPIAAWQPGARKFTEALLDSVLGVAWLASGVFLLLCAWRLWAPGRKTGQRPPPVFVAAVLTTLPFAHYFWSRPDLTHFAVSVLPLLVAVWTYPGKAGGVHRGGYRQLPLALVTLVSGVLAGSVHPLYQLLRPGPPLQTVLAGGEPLRVRDHTADQVRLLHWAADTYAAGGRPVYVVPYWPGAYAVTLRRAPTWESYLLFPLSPARQRRELERLVTGGVGVALVLQHRTDNRPDLGFDQTHPLIDRYLKRCLQPVRNAEAARLDVLVFVPSGTPCAMP